MQTKGNTILITGGGTGIGLALAEVFLREGSEVIICGRRQSRLEEAKKKLPRLQIHRCDVAGAAGRKALFEWAVSSFPQLNVLINNAGIQREIDFKRGPAAYPTDESEIETNLEAPIHLCALFIPHLMKKKEAALVNVSSGLAYVPMASTPVYCATKAGLHSFCISLRHQLRGTPIKVFEILPPWTDTELGGAPEESEEHGYRGAPAAGVAEEAVAAFGKDVLEIAVGDAKNLREGAVRAFEKTFRGMNERDA
jgi:uncharacterized oxidoreductase